VAANHSESVVRLNGTSGDHFAISPFASQPPGRDPMLRTVSYEGRWLLSLR
jgi:hypothetical protein